MTTLRRSALAAAIVICGAPGVAHARTADIPSAARTATAASPLAHIAALGYHGGPVLHSNRTHLIFWQPARSGMSFDAGYQSLIETFLAQVAADSHRPTNVYGLSGQYRDLRGPAAYDSRYMGSVPDVDPLPANGCSEPLLSGPGWRVCLNDSQLQSEIVHVIASRRLPTGDGNIYFLVTPRGLGSCAGSGPEDCALGGSRTGYCSYHSATPVALVLYAIIPYAAVRGHCQSDNPRPNSSTADPAISALSHEHAEIVTDPLGSAWYDPSGNEGGDLCQTSFGPALGGAPGATGATSYDQIIDGGHYYLQDEWSNDDGACESRDEADPIAFSASRHVVRGRPVAFSARAGDPDGAIAAYRWSFGDGRRGRGRRATHTFAKAGVYRVALRAVDRAGDYAFTTRLIRVAAGP